MRISFAHTREWCTRLLAFFASLVHLTGSCDPGVERLVQRWPLDDHGDLVAGTSALERACRAEPSLCPWASREIGRSALREASQALAREDYDLARWALSIAMCSKDPGVERAAKALSEDVDLTAWTLWDDAHRLPDDEDRRNRALVVAARGARISSAAQAWLDEHQPRLLFAKVRHACGVPGPCTETAQELISLYPTRPEADEAAALANALFERVHPRLVEAESLLEQRAMAFDHVRLLEACLSGSSESQEGGPRPKCDRADDLATDSQVVGVILKQWTIRLTAISDPFYVRNLEERFVRARDFGEYDPEVWQRPFDRLPRSQATTAGSQAAPSPSAASSP